ncbi:hypothetical protein [Solimonas terrae]|uniref:Lipoprotein n=1 Tax=Solimonas terrae TaxID=1396819 RepID=A0A6M2BN78_9GAMM|nr:hypothetical protein [Solimonas terrae]NGY03625.1 hypothetical protein [Solimonas terrae]
MNIKTLAAAFATAALLGGCSLFSLTPDADVVAQVHRQVPVGASLDTAEANLASLGFSCSPQRGAYTDERGNDHENAHFLQCARRPGTISFACENRDQVVVVPGDTGKVAAVEVSHGPDCGARQ